MHYSFFIYLLLTPFVGITQSISNSETMLINAIEKINPKPTSISFHNSLDINNHGGHLQGIQYINHKQNDFYVMSGSSDTYSYYSIVKIGNKNLVISTKILLEKPFKHAGGFQIYRNLMAIGVEDNELKNKSKVLIFNIEDPEKPPAEPIAVIDRLGTTKRATAGCVGITVIRGKVLVVVGDWDTEHLDFYRIDHEKLGLDGEALELEYSLDTRKIDKSGWSDNEWLSYQNINFITDASGDLYLTGMTSNSNKKNTLDLFKVNSEELSIFKLKKVYSKNFESNPQTTFRWGAGIHVTNDMKLKVFSCGENILETSTIHIYQ